MASNLFLFTGGARSGKSTYAEKMAAKCGEKVLYIATAACLDQEMERRVAKHQERRPANWETVEEQIEVRKVLEENKGQYEAVLMDCLTLFVSNLLFNSEIKDDDEAEKRVLKEIALLGKAAAEYTCPVIIVSNEVGSGIVPDNSLSRLYRDIVGKANQILAEASREVYLVTAGIPLPLKELKQKLGVDF